MAPHLDRRAFLLGGLGGLAVLERALDARPGPAPARTLVLLQFTGGHDGLSMLVPYSDDGYARARKSTRIPAEEVLAIDERVGLHPRLAKLRALHERGRTAWIEGVGYPNPNRSHFRSMDIWHAADERGRGAGEGWIGRCVEHLVDPRPQSVVHLGTKPPFSLHGSRAPLCLTPALLRVTGAASAEVGEGDVLEAACAPGSAAALLGTMRRQAEESLALVHAALDRPRGEVRYPGSDLARDLRNAAALIHAELGMRVCSVELDGFDTHRDQRKRHDRLMGDLDAALGAFLSDLEQSEAGRETLVLAFSEFGRRVQENDSGGTDHGSGGLALALGTRVHGGLHGKPPSLSELVEGDLGFTTDFRSVYAECIAHVFGIDPALVLGASYPGLRFV